jgi:biotin-(acetyl-CoA carboxylase) ligase
MAHLAIGIGVNLIAAPDPGLVEQDALRPVSLLAETGIRVSPERFLQALAPAYDRRERTFCTQGFAPLRQEWLAHAARLGQPIRARTAESTRVGIFETIDPGGPYGAKEAGEGPLHPIIPAIANAIWDAVVVRLRTLPFTPDRVLAALQAQAR